MYLFLEKKRLFYLQRDYAVFISLQYINFRPTEYEGFEMDPSINPLITPFTLEASFISVCTSTSSQYDFL